jgi:hypothetical protein
MTKLYIIEEMSYPQDYGGGIGEYPEYKFISAYSTMKESVAKILQYVATYPHDYDSCRHDNFNCVDKLCNICYNNISHIGKGNCECKYGCDPGELTGNGFIECTAFCLRITKYCSSNSNSSSSIILKTAKDFYSIEFQ